MENALAFDALFGPGEFLIFFDCPDEEMQRRILERGKVPPQSSNWCVQTSGRVDDNAVTAKNRIATFHAQSTEPMEYFLKMGTKAIRLDTLRSVEENVQLLLDLPLFKLTQYE